MHNISVDVCNEIMLCHNSTLRYLQLNSDLSGKYIVITRQNVSIDILNKNSDELYYKYRYPEMSIFIIIITIISLLWVIPSWQYLTPSLWIHYNCTRINELTHFVILVLNVQLA